ncbi:MAG: hypothetical protein P1U56_15255 [Saprospiraceae bacterium]|nr:hypothetical protein [Saprospiraceae bacterium]
MENNEKYLIHQIKNHREEIDVDGLWEEVSGNIPKEKRKKRFGFWVFSGVILFGIIAGALKFSSDSTILSTKQLALVPDLSVGTASIEKEVVPPISDKIIQAKKVTASASTSTDKSTYETKAIHGSTNFTPVFSKKQSNVDQFTLKEANRKTGEIMPSEIIGESHLEIAKSTGRELVGSIQMTAGQLDNENVGKRDFLTIEFLNTIESVLKWEPLHLKGEVKPTRINLEKEKKAKAKNKWSFYVLGGGGLASRSLRTVIPELRSEMDRRNEVVDVLGMWKIEGGVGFRITPKLTVYSGINLTQIHERAYFVSEFVEGNEIETESTIYLQDGTVESIAGTTVINGIQKVTETRYNQWRTIQLPITLSLNLMDLDKINVRAGASFAYSFHQKYQGFTSFSGSQNRYDLSQDEDGKFRTFGGYSYGIHFEGITHLSRMVDLGFRIGYNKLNNINSTQYLIDQKYTTIDFSSGLYFRF